MNRTPAGDLACPYCNRPLRWVAMRWFGRGCFECDQCGEFPDMRDTAGPSAEADQAPSPRLPKSTGRPRVLLVDDSAEHNDLYALMLEPAVTVITASHGEDALRIAAAEPPDAIVLDVLMPGMDGWEVCSRLKSNPATRNIPVIMLTSLEGGDLAARAERAGAAAILMKPCPVERLALEIDAAIYRQIEPARSVSRAVSRAQTRRWTRKPVKTALTASLDGLPANLINVSYGGLCAELGQGHELPSLFEVTFASSTLSIQAEAVWMSRGDGNWICGAEVANGNDAWRAFVDAIS
jgi:CheY-like chemotaxis protein